MLNKSRLFKLLFFILLVAGVALSGVQFRPGAWYMALQKPFWTPPGWLFPPVWTVLYGMIAVAGWRIFAGTSRFLKALWLTQLVLNGLWSWLFFGMHQTGLGLIDICAMLAAIATMVAISRRIDRNSAWLLTPYLIWVGYATTLNLAIYLMNRP